MKKEVQTLRFRTRWLNNTLKIICTANDKYHKETRLEIERFAALCKDTRTQRTHGL